MTMAKYRDGGKNAINSNRNTNIKRDVLLFSVDVKNKLLLLGYLCPPLSDIASHILSKIANSVIYLSSASR